MTSPNKQSTTARSMATCEGANQRFRELERLRKAQDPVLRKINKIHFKLSTTAPVTAEKLSTDLWSKLRTLYVQAKSLAEEEESLLGSTILQLDALISPGRLQQPPPPHRKKPPSNTADPKRKRINTNANESPRMSSSPAVPRTPSAHSSINVGDQVAARVSPEDAENHEWIVVKVTGKDRDGKSFEVVDEEPDDDGETGGRPYTLPISCIIPFPKRSDVNYSPDFPQGSHVLAVYPGTTALYKACVVGPQRKKMKFDDVFSLEFDGDEEEGVEGLPRKPVPFHNVVALPEGHRQ
ncbi:unnamed protein product [Calypogeia fissa]